MGGLTSRQNVGVEEMDLAANHAYRYPPKSGSYFGSHFIMGGERFDTPQPEAYLFGENSDLNFLGNKPAPFPYPAPQPNEPTKTLKSLVNIRKESLRFVRAPDDANVNCRQNGPTSDRKEVTPTRYNIEFTFDSDIRCAITIHYFCSEEITPSGANYVPRDPAMNSETYHYKCGANQQFAQVSHVFDPSQYTDEELNYSFEKDVLPVVIQCVADEGDDPKQSHMTVAIVEKNSDSTYSLKALKQKQYVDGLCYLLQEIYGIENKNAEFSKAINCEGIMPLQTFQEDCDGIIPSTATDDEVEDNGSECVICMCDIRDTLILPCRHLCLCNCCADSLRYQANNCPICRAPFRALLQIRALRKATVGGGGNQTTGAGDGGQAPKSENVPHGYEAVGLIEALNGPPIHIPSVPTAALQLNRAAILPSAPLPPIVPSAPPLTIEMTVALPVAQQQDAITSPALPVPVDSTNCRNYTGSFSSIQVAATMEDCAAQTDCPVEIVTASNLMPEICLSVMLPDSPEKDTKGVGGGGDVGSGTAAQLKTKAKSKLQRSRTASLEKVVVVKKDNETMPCSGNTKRGAESTGVNQSAAVQPLSEAQSLVEVRSPLVTFLSRKTDKTISASTPDSLNLCEKANVQGALNCLSGADGHPAGDLSPGGEESDYYTPEDPNTTILSERRMLTSRAEPCSVVAAIVTDSGSIEVGGSVGGMDSDGGGQIEELEEGTPLKGAMPTYIEAISLPGTPLSHGSNRSSGDSFSSMSSTRLLLPNQSQETLAEDRMQL